MARLAPTVVSSLLLCGCVGLLGASTANAASLNLRPFPSDPRTEEQCSAVDSYNNNAISRWNQEATREADQSLKIGSTAWSREYNRIIREADIRWRDLERNRNDCSQRLAAARRVAKAEQQERENQERQARQAQLDRQNQQEKFVAQNRQYEAIRDTAKRTYSDLAAAGRVIANPREEVPRIIGEKIQEVAGLSNSNRAPDAKSTASAYYSAAHDRTQDVTIGVAPRSAGVGAIQDATSDEIKRRNLALVAELDRLDSQLKNIASNGSSSNLTTGPLSASSGTLVVPNTEINGLPPTNPWAPTSTVAGTPVDRVADSIDNPPSAVPPLNPWNEAPSSLNSSDNPFASSAPMTTRSNEVQAALHDDETLFRDPRTRELKTVPKTSLSGKPGGDAVVNGKVQCSKTGLGIVLASCESQRTKGK